MSPHFYYLETNFTNSCEGTGLQSYINAENEHLCNPEALDLLSKLLTYDHVRQAIYFTLGF